MSLILTSIPMPPTIPYVSYCTVELLLIQYESYFLLEYLALDMCSQRVLSYQAANKRSACEVARGGFAVVLLGAQYSNAFAALQSHPRIQY